MGTAPPARSADSWPGSPRVPATSSAAWLPSHRAETLRALPRPAPWQPQRPSRPPSHDQEGRLASSTRHETAADPTGGRPDEPAGVKSQAKTGLREIREFRIQGRAGLDRALLGFAQDASGEIYALVIFPGVPFGNTGEVLKLVPAAR